MPASGRRSSAFRHWQILVNHNTGQRMRHCGGLGVLVGGWVGIWVVSVVRGMPKSMQMPL